MCHWFNTALSKMGVDKTKDTLEGKVLEERDLGLYYKHGIKMMDSREEHWRYVAEDDKDRGKPHYLRWYFYTKDKDDLINRKFFVFDMHLKGGNTVWTYMKDNIINGTRNTNL